MGKELHFFCSYDIESGQETVTFNGRNGSIHSAVFCMNGEYVLTDSGDNTLKLWSIETGNAVMTFSGHISTVNSVTINSGGNKVLSCSDDGTVIFWDFGTGSQIASFISFSAEDWLCFTYTGYYVSSPKGDYFINVRYRNQIGGITDILRYILKNPDMVRNKLSGSQHGFEWDI